MAPGFGSSPPRTRGMQCGHGRRAYAPATCSWATPSGFACLRTPASPVRAFGGRGGVGTPGARSCRSTRPSAACASFSPATAGATAWSRVARTSTRGARPPRHSRRGTTGGAEMANADDAQVTMEQAAARRQLDKIRGYVKRLELVEGKIRVAIAELPMLLREVEALREALTGALGDA